MKCPACGAAPWYIIHGCCHDCGYDVNKPLPTELPVRL